MHARLPPASLSSAGVTYKIPLYLISSGRLFPQKKSERSGVIRQIDLYSNYEDGCFGAANLKL